jgi:hypothetical protein
LSTLFDYLTVACFLVMAVAFFMLTERETRTLARLLISGIVFAVANQVGNNGWTILGLALVAGGAAYAVLTIRDSHGRAAK